MATPDTAAAARPRRPRITLTQQIFIGLALGIVVGWFVSNFHPDWAIYFRPVQPALPAPDQDDHRAVDLRDAGRRHRRRRTLQGRRPDGPARDHLFRGRHDAGAGHRAGGRQHHPARRRRQPADGPAVARSPRSRRPGIRSCCTSSPSRSSMRWPKGDVLQIVVFSIIFAHRARA